jgi:hypothetical protein
MKYKYICVIIMTIYYVYYICHMYHVHVSPISKRIVPVMNATLPIVSPTLKDIHTSYSYHKQTLSLFYKKRREGQRHIR